MTMTPATDLVVAEGSTIERAVVSRLPGAVTLLIAASPC